MNSKTFDELKKEHVFRRIESKNREREEASLRQKEHEQNKMIKSLVRKKPLFNNHYEREAKRDVADSITRVILDEDVANQSQKYYALMMKKVNNNALSGIMKDNENVIYQAHESPLAGVAPKSYQG